MLKITNLIKPVAAILPHTFKVTCGNKTHTLIIKNSKSLHTGFSKLSQENVEQKQEEHSLMDFKGQWPLKELSLFKNDMKVLPDFITDVEETQLFEEVEPYMKRLRYEYDHWDDAIHGFRETERKHWYPYNRQVLERVQKVGFDGEIMPFIHVLDLAPQGVIKPHVDSIRYCGHTIAGLSLLSDAVMRLVRTQSTDQDHDSGNDTNDAYRSQPKAILENNFYVDILLPKRSLYIMSHTARYNFTHEILANEESKFQGQTIIKQRRISIICRNDP